MLKLQTKMDNKQLISELAEKYVLGKLQNEELTTLKDLWAKDDKGLVNEAILFHQTLQSVTLENEESLLQNQCLQWMDEIESKVKRVAAERDDYQHHNAILLGENKELKDELSKQSKMIHELQERLVNSQQILIGKGGEVYAKINGKSSSKKSI